MEEKGQLGDKSPRVWSFLFDCFLPNILVLEVVRSKDNFALVMFNLNVNQLSTEYLVFSKRLTKTRDGNGKDNLRNVKPRLYAISTHTYPVQIYKTFLKRHPKQINSQKSLSHLLHSRIPDAPDSDIWFYQKPGPIYFNDCNGVCHRSQNIKTCVKCKTLRKARVARDKIKKIMLATKYPHTRVI